MSGNWTSGRTFAEHGPNGKKFTLVVGNKRYPRRVAALVMGGVVVVMGGFFASVLGLIYWGKQVDARSAGEEAGLAQLAREHGWSYEPSRSGVVDRLEGVEPFPDVSTGLLVSDYTHGRYKGREFRYFEYEDESTGTGADSRETSEYYAVFAVSTPGEVPRTVFREEGFLDSVFGGGKIVATGDAEFDADNRVIAEDRAAAKQLAAPGLTRYLLHGPALQDRPLRFENGEVLTWHEERLRPRDVLRKLDYLSRVVDHSPARAWQ
ncbi:hypothetical protein G4Z16_17940 [Streptomyces bathyalis]|uniref:Uncharacterized protein n=1 Tax=Streptomyces bathyalis TaxID=2710756 RepID=A0A7T1WRF4_9ACTN|nr:hypothetical protein [Streptomyces bathyalis]QPP07973.1 hypothetical protein G4Z16_17940 [Streptomyces bathyalis]